MQEIGQDTSIKVDMWWEFMSLRQKMKGEK